MKSPILSRLRPIIEPEFKQEKLLYTGRFLVTALDESQGIDRIKEVITQKAGMRSAQTSDFNERTSISENEYEDADAFIYDDLGIAVIGSSEEQNAIMNNFQTEYNYIVEPEEMIFVPDPIIADISEQFTWGLRETKVEETTLTGEGVKVAILDTGFEFNHPDFNDRNIVYNSFVPDEDVSDLNGHGTHCIGTACGEIDINGTRYGIANGAEIHIGKVLGGVEGVGTDIWIINAIIWAVKGGCDIISMSLGSPVYPRQSYKRAYERVARYALDNNSLIIAAAGNDSRRDMGIIQPISSPSNCPSVMAVGAIDIAYHLANFSNGSINPDGQVDIVGPGVGIYSSWLMEQRYHTISGTSMATPHVAGIAALYKEKHPNASATQLWHHLITRARRLHLNSVDVGAGLIQAQQI
jgi:subtilisin family serine protease